MPRTISATRSLPSRPIRSVSSPLSIVKSCVTLATLSWGRLPAPPGPDPPQDRRLFLVGKVSIRIVEALQESLILPSGQELLQRTRVDAATGCSRPSRYLIGPLRQRMLDGHRYPHFRHGNTFLLTNLMRAYVRWSTGVVDDGQRVQLAVFMRVEIARHPPLGAHYGSSQPYPGFSLDDSDALRGTRTDMPVTWNGSPDLSALVGKQAGLPALRDHQHGTLFVQGHAGIGMRPLDHRRLAEMMPAGRGDSRR